jgi:uncharacterized protein (DUF488 family)
VVLFTAGYEGRSLGDFLTALNASGVRLLADVREAPISRKRGFSKSALAAALHDAGIDYLHIRALGCPKPIRDAYRHDGDWARYTRDYLKHLQQQQGAVMQLAGLADAQPTALLCYEADFKRCHRTYVACAVAAQSGARICHITAAGLINDPAAPPATAVSPASWPP